MRRTPIFIGRNENLTFFRFVPNRGGTPRLVTGRCGFSPTPSPEFDFSFAYHFRQAFDGLLSVGSIFTDEFKHGYAERIVTAKELDESRLAPVVFAQVLAFLFREIVAVEFIEHAFKA